ncbi:hypothetical protein EC988_008605 [Linderina pennispora]|nr:hypothetical protein EC988_008605 [Linderina pennispora]
MSAHDTLTLVDTASTLVEPNQQQHHLRYHHQGEDRASPSNSTIPGNHRHGGRLASGIGHVVEAIKNLPVSSVAESISMLVHR